MDNKQEQLDALRQEVEKCELCEISKHINRKVFGEGPSGATIVSLSEAPGSAEDVKGRPYQGAAGKRWEEILQENNWNRESLYVMNAQCCRPIDNKLDKDLHTIANCNYFMLRQLTIIEPKLILAFGKTALYALGLIDKEGYEKKKMGDLLGEYKWNEASVIVLYHPSYLLRQPNKSWDVYLQMCRAKEIANDLKLEV